MLKHKQQILGSSALFGHTLLVSSLSLVVYPHFDSAGLSSGSLEAYGTGKS